MWSRVYDTLRCPSVCLPQHGPSAANPLLQVSYCGPGRQEIRSIAAGAAGKCGQWHVVSVRRPLNTHTRRRLQFPSLLHVISTTSWHYITQPTHYALSFTRPFSVYSKHGHRVCVFSCLRTCKIFMSNFLRRILAYQKSLKPVNFWHSYPVLKKQRWTFFWNAVYFGWTVPMFENKICDNLRRRQRSFFIGLKSYSSRRVAPPDTSSLVIDRLVD